MTARIRRPGCLDTAARWHPIASRPPRVELRMPGRASKAYRNAPSPGDISSQQSCPRTPCFRSPPIRLARLSSSRSTHADLPVDCDETVAGTAAAAVVVVAVVVVAEAEAVAVADVAVESDR